MLEAPRWSRFADLLERRLGAAESKARKKGWCFDLDLAVVEKMFRAQGGRCAVSGLHFNLLSFDDCLVKHPLAPSIDRIDARRGYCHQNVRLVCTSVNFGLGQYGYELLRVIAAGILRQDEGNFEVPGSWEERQRQRLLAAQKIAEGLRGHNLVMQRRRIAAIKATLTKGSARIAAIAEKAAQTKQGRGSNKPS